MANDNNALKAGSFIVVALLLAAGVLLAIKGLRGWIEPGHTVSVAFDLAENLGGLKVGDPVRVGGFDQGRVSDIRFVAGDKPHWEVDFHLPKKFALHADTRLAVEQGLTGTANLNITDFGRGDAWNDKTVLDGRASPLTDFYALAPELTGLVGAVRAKVNPAYDRYDKTLGNADSAVLEAKKAMAAFTDFLGGSGPDLRGTLANMNKATDTLNQRLPKTLDKADAFIDDTRATVSDIRSTVGDARKALLAARDTINDAHTLITRNRSRIDNILASARETASNLEGASAEIRRSPWRLLYKPSADEVNNLQLYDTTRQFARAAGQLNDAAGAIRDAAADPNVDRKQLQSLMDDLKATFAKYRAVEQTLWQGVK
jgi:ABC-type transporter Mla subunit MlaD